jgi:hypothetical protein
VPAPGLEAAHLAALVELGERGLRGGGIDPAQPHDLRDDLLGLGLAELPHDLRRAVLVQLHDHEGGLLGAGERLHRDVRRLGGGLAHAGRSSSKARR